MKKRKIIIDVDTGTDDAIALMAAMLSPEFEIVGVTTIAGNLPLENTTANTLRVVGFLNPDIPVVRGCDAPLVRDLDPRRKFCDNEDVIIQENGEVIAFHVDEFSDLPETGLQPVDTNAVCWFVDTLKHTDEKITVVLLGPQTNFAMALRADPSIIEGVEELVIMGGGYRERNSTAAAEFNFFMDPEAACIIMNANIKKTLITLDATHYAVLDTEDVWEMRSWGTVTGNFVAHITEERIKAYNTFQPLFKPNSASMHDALCIMYLLDPTVITKKELLRCYVAFGGGVSDGQLIVDTRPCAEAGNCYVCQGIDDKKFTHMLLEILRRAAD